MSNTVNDEFVIFRQSLHKAYSRKISELKYLQASRDQIFTQLEHSKISSSAFLRHSPTIIFGE